MSEISNDAMSFGFLSRYIGVQLPILCVPLFVGVDVESSVADITCIAHVTLYYLLNYLNLPLWQFDPVNPGGQIQRKPLLVNPAWQVPLFKHGLLLQGFC